jgi:hypothetical protein
MPPDFVAWLASTMLAWAPQVHGSHAVRYSEIATDLVNVATEAPLYDGPDAIERTAIQLAAIAAMESFFRVDVDTFKNRGDDGLAWGLMQVHLLPGERCETRIECLQLGRERVRLSFDRCHELPPDDRLSEYTSGRCQTNAASRYRMWKARNAWIVWRKVNGNHESN